MANQTGLQFTVKMGALPESTFAVADFGLQEELNQPYTLMLNLASAQPGIDFGAVLDQPCELCVWYDGQLQRRVSGIVSRFTQGDTGFHRTRYQAEVRPALWRLGLRTNCRIFQQKKPDEIISELLKEAGISDFAFSLRHEHAEREYCVQYRESDLDFITRLAAEEGMFFFHEFGEQSHRIMFADNTGALEEGAPLYFNSASQGLSQGAFINRFRYAEAVSTAQVELKDYCFKTPAYGLSQKKVSGDLSHQRDQYEHYDYPGRFKQDASGKPFSGFRLDALRSGAISGSGNSNCAALRPGLRFAMTEHPSPGLNLAWQVVGVTHEGKQPQGLEEEGGSGAVTLHNHFSVMKASGTWRAVMPYRPMVDGPQIATVTGPAGEEIYCDKYGRVKVQFPWDRYGASDEQSSCWVRVSQGWAGGQYGLIAIPRIGHEVVVSFLEGDPDQPLITGRTFHATNQTPYVLPEHKTRTTLRTDTHKGEGFNELRFEDESTLEQIYLHGQKDMDAVINNIQRQSIGRDRHLSVAQDTFERINRHSHREVGKDDIEQIGQDHHQTIGRSLFQSIGQSLKRLIGGGEVTSITGARQSTITGSEELIIGANHRVTVNAESYLKAADIVLEAGQALTIKAPGGFIKIDGSGVTIVGSIVKINDGGSAGSGTAPISIEPEAPATPTKPEAPDRR